MLLLIAAMMPNIPMKLSSYGTGQQVTLRSLVVPLELKATRPYGTREAPVRSLESATARAALSIVCLPSSTRRQKVSCILS
jgi:hypothetical protein